MQLLLRALKGFSIKNFRIESSKTKTMLLRTFYRQNWSTQITKKLTKILRENFNPMISMKESFIEKELPT